MMSPDTRKHLLVALAGALAYAGALWGLFNWEKTSQYYHVISYSFLFLMPLALGALVNHLAPPAERRTTINLIWKPTGVVILSLSLSLVLHMEGLICVFMAAPLLLLMASLGAFLHYKVADHLEERSSRKALFILALSPILIAPVETTQESAVREVRTVTSIRIRAPREVVWQHIIRVAAIAPEEMGFGFAKAIGFPDPVEATLSREGIGGVRKASFKGDVVFTETIDAWEEGKLLSFSIVPNTAEIPPTTLDEHVIVGGEYFKVLRGTYEIHPDGDGTFRLILSSEHQSITPFNFYASLWGHLIMRDIQARILEVIKNRCEGKAAA